MATKKTRPTKKTLPPRSHLPALNEARLALTLQALGKASSIPAEAKRALEQSLLAARNPNAERPDVAIETLDPRERADVKAAQADYARILGGPLARGRAALLQMSDEEWRKATGQSEEDTPNG